MNIILFVYYVLNCQMLFFYDFLDIDVYCFKFGCVVWWGVYIYVCMSLSFFNCYLNLFESYVLKNLK